MLKTIRLFNILAFKKNESDNKIIRFDIDSNNIKFVKKLRKSKNPKLFKF